MWEKVTEAFAANGIEVPSELESLYKDNRAALNDNYTGAIKQAEAAGEQYKAVAGNLF